MSTARLVTAAHAECAAGCEVAVFSWIERHPGISFDIVIWDLGLTADWVQRLTRIAPGIRCERPRGSEAGLPRDPAGICGLAPMLLRLAGTTGESIFLGPACVVVRGCLEHLRTLGSVVTAPSAGSTGLVWVNWDALAREGGGVFGEDWAHAGGAVADPSLGCAVNADPCGDGTAAPFHRARMLCFDREPWPWERPDLVRLAMAAPHAVKFHEIWRNVARRLAAGRAALPAEERMKRAADADGALRKRRFPLSTREGTDWRSIMVPTGGPGGPV